MKLPIEREFLDKIKNGEKKFDWRDAHITFVAIDNGEEVRVEVKNVRMTARNHIPEYAKKVCTEEEQIEFKLE